MRPIDGKLTPLEWIQVKQWVLTGLSCEQVATSIRNRFGVEIAPLALRTARAVRAARAERIDLLAAEKEVEA